MDACPVLYCRYHVPRQWLRPKRNLIILFEEKGGNPDAITIATSMPQQLCSHVSESHPLPLLLSPTASRSSSWNISRHTKQGAAAAEAAAPPIARAPLSVLECADGQRISRISFASYGTPAGDCGGAGFVLRAACHSNTSLDVLSKVRVSKFPHHLTVN